MYQIIVQKNWKIIFKLYLKNQHSHVYAILNINKNEYF